MIWEEILAEIQGAEQAIRTDKAGVPMVARDLPLYELRQLLVALTTGYNTLYVRDMQNKQKIHQLEVLARAQFPARKEA